MSSTKRVLRPYLVISNGDMSGSLTSSETNVQFLDYLFYQIEWTGSSPVGVINFEYLKTEAPFSTTGVDVWEKIDFGGSVGTDIPISGASGSHQVTFNQVAFPKVRVQYVRTSGTGTLKVIVVGKEV